MATWIANPSTCLHSIFLLFCISFMSSATARKLKVVPVASHRASLNVSGEVCVTRECTLASAGLLKAMNSSADRCEEPYNHACGQWLQDFELPADEESWYMAYSGIEKENRGILRRLAQQYSCEEAKTLATSSNAESSTPDVWDAMYTCYFETCLGLQDRDKLGAEPLFDLMLSEVPFLLESNFTEESLNLHFEDRRRILAQRMSSLMVQNVDILFDIRVSPSIIKHDGRHVVYLSQVGTEHSYNSFTGLSYRLFEQPDMVAKYRTHLQNLLHLLNDALANPSGVKRKVANPNLSRSVEERVDAILQLEMNLKNISLSPEQLRDTVAITIPRKLSQVKEMMKAVDIDIFLRPFKQMFPSDAASLDDDSEVFLDSKTYLSNISDMIVNGSKTDDVSPVAWDWLTIHDYFLTHFIATWGKHLSSEWRLEFERYKKDMTGAETPPRWRVCLEQDELDWVVARRFVRETGAEKAKTITEDMVKFLADAFASRFAEYEWMDQQTRDRALSKLRSINYKISHPSWLLNDYDTHFRRYFGPPDLGAVSSYFNAKLHLWNATLRYRLSLMGKPKDPTIWEMFPQTVNAYYCEVQNEIVFPASILRPPFLYIWDKSATTVQRIGLQVLNFGGLGSVIAHELTHAFDDDGRHFDEHGQLVDWWTEQSATRFNELADCFRKQYSAYSVELEVDDPNGSTKKETFNLSGELTLGENIADNGGTRLSWIGMKKAIGKDLQAYPKVLPGGFNMSAEELFFLGYSCSNCDAHRDNYLRRLVLSDPHSPGRFRTDGVLRNMPEFHKLAGCRAMPPPDKLCAIW